MLLAITALVAVEGDTTCPAPEQVRDRLGALLADNVSGVKRDGDRARLASVAGGVELELDSPSGRALGRRTFGLQASCDELAATIAVVIATWEISVSDVAVTLPVATSETIATVQLRPTVRPRALSLEVAAGAAAVIDRGGWAPAGMGELAIGPASRRWAGVVELVATGANDVSVAPGSASWARERIGLGGRARVVGQGPFAIEVSGRLVGAVLVASGAGFSTDHTSITFDPGAAIGLRAGYGWGTWRMFAAADETVWFRANHLEVTGLSETDAPRNDLVMTLGVSYQVKP